MNFLRAQGATEYLVLLAVVLIVALVSVALFGFFPGMASDAQITQSQTYWKSASPIAIVDSSPAYRYSSGTYIWMYLRFRNTGAYPIRLSKILGKGASISIYYSASLAAERNLTDIYLSPGEEICISDPRVPPGSLCNAHVEFNPWSAGNYVLGAVDQSCDSSGQGTVTLKDFGFEYIEYIEGQQITKRETGQKPFIARCAGTL